MRTSRTPQRETSSLHRCILEKTVEGNWKQFNGELKAPWGRLAGDELDVVSGRRDKLVGKIEKRYCVTRNEAEKQVQRLEQSNKD